MLTDIHSTIFADLHSFASTNTVGIEFPNVDFTPGTEPYIKVNVLFATNFNEGLSIVNRPGILQIDVMYRDGVGIIQASNLADLLLSWIPRNRRMLAGEFCIAFNSEGYISPPLNLNDGWLQMPVNFNFRVLN